MKIKQLLLAFILLISTILFSCSNTEKSMNSKDYSELVVFAAASLTETLTEIGKNFEKNNPYTRVIYNFDSSGTLKTQIENGAYSDIFISAAPKQMNQLDITASKDVNTNSLDYILDGTRFNLLENKVALTVSKNNVKNIQSFNSLVEALNNKNILLAIGNSDVPVGQYTKKIFSYFNLDETSLSNDGLLTYGSNVKEVTTQVKEEIADCGIVYQTDAYSANLKVIDTATKEMCGEVIYPVAILNITKNENLARRYLEYLKTDESKNIFKQVGFTPLT